MIKNYLLIFALCCMTGIFLVGCQDEAASDKVINHRPDSEDIAIVEQGTSELAVFYDSIEEMKKDTDAVIYGEVKKNSYYVSEGTIYTIETIHVLDSLYGDIDQDSIISVFAQGGYILMNDYINSYSSMRERDYQRNMGRFASYTDEEIKTKYIAQLSDGYADKDVGDRSIIFLEYRDKEEELYESVGAWQGEYLELSDGVFLKQSPTVIMCGTTVKELVEKMNDPNDEDSISDSVITYEEIQEKIR